MDAEVIVIGGGIVGLWAAYHLVKQGIRTIVFEQFPYPHTRGSSHGQSRIICYANVEEEYASMMAECFRKWKQLQIESREELFLKTGLIKVFNMTKADDVTAFYGMMDQMDKYAPEVEIIPGEDLKKRFPGLNFDSKHRAIYDESTGLLKADKCLLVLQELILKHGGKIFDGEGVLSIHHVNASKVNVETKKKTYSGRSVIIACGPFTNKLLLSVGIQLPLEPRKPTVLYWRDQSATKKYSVDAKFPCTSLQDSYYSVPSYEYPGLIKLCYDAIVSLDPERPNVLSAKDQDAEKRRMTEFKFQIRNNFPEVDATEPAIVENCMYTRTPDYGFIIDHHPKFKNIVIGAGFSGHGFKTAPSVGHMLSNMALGLLPPYSSEPFAIKRFTKKSML